MAHQIKLRVAMCPAVALGLAATAFAASVPRTCADDFDQFWQRSLSATVALAPSALGGEAPGWVSFDVTTTVSAEGYYCPGGNHATATPIIFIYEDEGAALHFALPADRSYLYLRWRDGDAPLADWYLSGLPDRRACSLRRAILTGCQAVDLVRTDPSVQAARVGLVGDGFGAVVALAVAALMPERVAFVIAHQPRPAYHRLADGAVSSCPAVRKIVQKVSADPKSSDSILSALTYFDAINFVPLVEAPTLFIAGDADREAPLAEVLQLYDCLRCECDLVVFEGLEHCPTASLAAFPELLRRWLAQVETGGRRVTSP